MNANWISRDTCLKSLQVLVLCRFHFYDFSFFLVSRDTGTLKSLDLQVYGLHSLSLSSTGCPGTQFLDQAGPQTQEIHLPLPPECFLFSLLALSKYVWSRLFKDIGTYLFIVFETVLLCSPVWLEIHYVVHTYGDPPTWVFQEQ